MARLRAAALAVSLALVAAAVAVLVYQHNTGWMYDGKVYRAGGAAALHGLDVYANVPPAFTYTPFAALVFVPLTFLPVNGIGFLLTAISLLCLEGTVWLCVPGQGRSRIATWAVTCSLAIWLDPVSLTLLLGQVNLVLLLLVLADLSLPDGSRWKGVGTGVAAGIKLTPAFFAVYLALTGRVRAAAVAASTFAATVVIGFVLLPADALRYWGGTFLDSSRVGDPQNVRSQSLRSLLVRWAHTTHVDPVWLVLALAVAAVALALAVWAHRRGDELLAMCVCATAVLLVSPITWQHHWVWMVPALVWMVRRAWRTRSWPLAAFAAVVALEFYARPYQWGIPVDRVADLHLDTLQLLRASTYGVTALLILGLAALTLLPDARPTTRRRPLREPEAGPTPS